MELPANSARDSNVRTASPNKTKAMHDGTPEKPQGMPSLGGPTPPSEKATGSSSGKRARATGSSPQELTKRARTDVTASSGVVEAKKSPKSKGTPKSKGKPSPRPAVIEERDGEGPLDLAAIRQFEYEAVSRFGQKTLRRYESYRRSDLKKDKVKKVCQSINPALAKVTDQYLIALKGLAKVFVGDVVETAIEVKEQFGDTGPIQPKHLREAFRRLRSDGAVPSSRPRENPML